MLFKQKRFITFSLSLSWVVFVIIGYYYFHKPINLGMVQAIGVSILNIVIAGTITFLAGGIGRKLIPKTTSRSTEILIVQAVLGYGLLSFIWFLIGLIGGYQRWVAWIVLIVSIFSFWKHILSWGKDLKGVIPGFSPSNGLERFISIITFLVIGIRLIIALAPPLAWDTLMYHLEIPKQYLAQGGFFFISNNYYWGQPQLSEILFTWCGALFRWETATTLCWFMLVLFLIGVFELVKKMSHTGAWIALASLLAGETFRFMFSSGYVDGISALVGYAIWVIVLILIKEEDSKLINWMGVLLGMALWVKISNSVLVPILIVSLIMINLRHSNPWWKGWRAIFIGGIIFSIWLLVLWSYTGNPFYPYFFETPWVSQLRYSFFKANGMNPGTTILWMPIAITWHGLHQVYIEGKLIFATDVGPLLLGLGLIGLIGNLRDKISQIALVWVSVGLVGMIIGGIYSGLFWQTRLYYVLLTPIAYLVGKGWEVVSQIGFSRIRLRPVVGALVILVSILFAASDFSNFIKMNPLGVVIGTTNQKEYLEDNLGWYYETAQKIKDLSGSPKILTFWEPRGFYLPDDAYPDVWIDRWYVTVREFDAEEDILKSWRQSGFTYILINLTGMDYDRKNRLEYQSTDWTMLDDLLQSLPSPVVFGQTYALYEIP